MYLIKTCLATPEMRNRPEVAASSRAYVTNKYEAAEIRGEA